MCQLTRMQEVVDLSNPRAASRKAIDLGSEKSLSHGVCCSSDSCYQSMGWHRRPPTIFQKCGRTRLAHALALSQRERVVGFRASMSRLWRVFELRVAFRAQILNTSRARSRSLTPGDDSRPGQERQQQPRQTIEDHPFGQGNIRINQVRLMCDSPAQQQQRDFTGSEDAAPAIPSPENGPGRCSEASDACGQHRPGTCRCADNFARPTPRATTVRCRRRQRRYERSARAPFAAGRPKAYPWRISTPFESCTSTEQLSTLTPQAASMGRPFTPSFPAGRCRLLTTETRCTNSTRLAVPRGSRQL